MENMVKTPVSVDIDTGQYRLSFFTTHDFKELFLRPKTYRDNDFSVILTESASTTYNDKKRHNELQDT